MYNLGVKILGNIKRNTFAQRRAPATIAKYLYKRYFYPHVAKTYDNIIISLAHEDRVTEMKYSEYVGIYSNPTLYLCREDNDTCILQIQPSDKQVFINSNASIRVHDSGDHMEIDVNKSDVCAVLLMNTT